MEEDQEGARVLGLGLIFFQLFSYTCVDFDFEVAWAGPPSASSCGIRPRPALVLGRWRLRWHGCGFGLGLLGFVGVVLVLFNA